tara:strand:- start:1 stop:183 length:183 start_codon:yes stop_codon:yes gene_type:complete
MFSGFNSTQRKRTKLQRIRKKAFEAQRNGNLSLAGKYLLEAEILETQIATQEESSNEVGS